MVTSAINYYQNNRTRLSNQLSSSMKTKNCKETEYNNLELFKEMLGNNLKFSCAIFPLNKSCSINEAQQISLNQLAKELIKTWYESIRYWLWLGNFSRIPSIQV